MEDISLHLQMFSNADWVDYVYMFFGTLGGVITGLSLPAFNFLFGRILNTLNSTGSDFTDKINTLCIYFVIIACFNIVSGFLQVTIVVRFRWETLFC